ncbi:MAG: phosphoribosylformylglycinamidine synthase subunit PurL [Methanolobus sp.]|jgi:phosphoribosylformylglycinamidine synthase|uniref:phosphoribosylformylglycinamidine synthase subunit PurL n=1 Tax=Methanolobus sp. TaxID=1874737 RepID=UPI00258F1469|nr:phosphoribosylformylglycinamidine synthase subunit PurL [Methanolobus sp.]MDK2832112.1 phosphoribosylformylglycinamidine synthase subunit PurL [Methanolobus sp.]MDK2940454.1 phosphoribosylformylglycinamidine synthase subunit PurL [Methanolobus sp.]
MLPEDDLKIITEKMGREPNLVEQGCFLNLWSEHCSYRSSAPLLKTFTTTGDKVIIGPGDDAAIISFGNGWVLAIGMESHNHPSYVDPYNGAATGVGGIVRDIISMGARPIALMDPLYFGPLNNPKNLYLFEHIIEGIAGYGNCIGVPVVRGEAFFDESYSGNPLVNVVAVGLAREENVVTACSQKAGNKLVLMGSTTGRDGLGGASFASRDLSEDSEAEDRPSIQIGDPFTEKLVIEATLEAIGKGYVKSCRDLGAAGLAGASSEMAAKGNLGMKIIADNVILRESGMTPYEILIAESQERMLLEVEPENVDAVLDIAKKYDLNGSMIGELTEELNYTVQFQGEIAADIPVKLLTEGAPTFERPSTAPEERDIGDKPELPADLKKAIIDVLSSHNVASKRWIYRQYDHEVQVRTVTKPGDDAGILRIDGNEGIALSCGCNPRHTLLDPYSGGKGTVVENAMNLAVKGARGIAIVDCLNFGNPERPDIYWQFKHAILGLGDAARDLSIPVVGGNVSLYNESGEFKTAIVPTPSIGLAGYIKDVTKAPAGVFSNEGDTIILVGSTADELGGSEYYNIIGKKNDGKAPQVPENITAVVDALISLAESGKITASHDVSLGGIAVALAEMCEKTGAEVDLSNVAEGLRTDDILFSESYARALITTSEPDAVMEMIGEVPCTVIGTVGGNKLSIQIGGSKTELSLEEIKEARESLMNLMME